MVLPLFLLPNSLTMKIETISPLPQSMASVIGEQCKELMGGTVKDLTARDKDVLSALLFLARQIYTTHEGLAVMSRVNIVSLANDVLSVSGGFLLNSLLIYFTFVNYHNS